MEGNLQVVFLVSKYIVTFNIFEGIALTKSPVTFQRLISFLSMQHCIHNVAVLTFTKLVYWGSSYSYSINGSSSKWWHFLKKKRFLVYSIDFMYSKDRPILFITIWNQRNMHKILFSMDLSENKLLKRNVKSCLAWNLECFCFPMFIFGQNKNL